MWDQVISLSLPYSKFKSKVQYVLCMSLEYFAVLLIIVDNPHISVCMCCFTKNSLKMASFHLNGFRVFSWTSLMSQLELVAYPKTPNTQMASKSTSFHAVNSTNKCASWQKMVSFSLGDHMLLCLFSFSCQLEYDQTLTLVCYKYTSLNEVYPGQTWNKLHILRQDIIISRHSSKLLLINLTQTYLSWSSTVFSLPQSLMLSW